MSDENKEYTPEELLRKMLRDWDTKSLNLDHNVVTANWDKQQEFGITEIIKDFLDENVRDENEGVLRKCSKSFAWIHRDAIPRTQNQLPLHAEKLLYLALPKKLRDSLIGDLKEEFTTWILPKFGPSFAKVWYWKQAVWSVSVVTSRQLVKLLGMAWLGKAASWLFGKLGS